MAGSLATVADAGRYQSHCAAPSWRSTIVIVPPAAPVHATAVGSLTVSESNIGSMSRASNVVAFGTPSGANRSLELRYWTGVTVNARIEIPLPPGAAAMRTDAEVPLPTELPGVGVSDVMSTPLRCTISADTLSVAVGRLMSWSMRSGSIVYPPEMLAVPLLISWTMPASMYSSGCVVPVGASANA